MAADNTPPDNAPIFVPAQGRFNDPTHIVTLGRYYGQAGVIAARGSLTSQVREAGSGYRTGAAARQEQDTVRWTRWINELNKGRQWPLKRLFERLDPMLAPGIAIAVVPGHDPDRTASAVRTLARTLAASQDRTDATSCLVRHAPVRRILHGGPSYRALHRETIQVVNAERIAGRSVLLMDDIAKSGASLMACRQLLLDAGARRVQAFALGRVAVSPALGDPGSGATDESPLP